MVSISLVAQPHGAQVEAIEVLRRPTRPHGAGKAAMPPDSPVGTEPNSVMPLAHWYSERVAALPVLRLER